MDTNLDVLIIDDEPNIRKSLAVYCKDRKHRVTLAGSAAEALKESARQSFDIAFLDIRLGADNGLDLIPKLLADNPWLKIVVITAFASIDTAVQAIRAGAAEYLPKPFTPEQLDLATSKIRQVLSLEKKVASLQSALNDVYPEVDMASANPAMQRCLQLARQAADSDATILIRGESGTGKTVMARAVHAWSKRSRGPFTVVSCPSLSADLLQSELFGHVKGAFTDAVKDNPGRIALSEGGTLFLDEIGDLPVSLQPRLLRFIQERQYERVGDSAVRQADVRIVAATNQNLESMVKEGRFREDLLYRLNVIQIDIPPLRQRPEDIRPLSENLLVYFSKRYHRPSLGFSPEAANALAAHPWPGNTRELRNAIERAVILCQTRTVGLDSLPLAAPARADVPSLGAKVSLEKLEEEHIRRILAQAPSLEEAARILGIDQATLWRRRKEYGL